MKDVLLLALRVLAGGALVAAFAVLGDTLKPRLFAGLFSGAPSVATVSLLVTGMAMGPRKQAEYGFGMIAGAIGLVAYALLAAKLVKHPNAVVGSALSWAAWLVPAAAIYGVLMR